jgi:four helix bundle protein
MEKMINKNDLEQRLIDFAVLIIRLCDTIFNTRAGNHVAGQLVRSGTSPALHYGEMKDAESKYDFIHKAKVILKELRETSNALQIVKRVPLTKNLELINKAIKECILNELEFAICSDVSNPDM